MRICRQQPLTFVPDGECPQLEYRIKHAQGSWRWHLCRLRPVRNAQRELLGWVGSLTDVDDLMRVCTCFELELGWIIDRLISWENRLASQLCRTMSIRQL